MSRAIFAVAVAALALGTGGCGGHYILLVPDHVVPVGAEVAVVAQLRRNDFFVLNLVVRGAAMKFSVGHGRMRAAYTDKMGYAGALVPVPDRSGRYRVSVRHTDYESGQEIAGGAYLYLWDAARPVLAVDLESLPHLGQVDLPAARAVLRRFARDGNVLYLTRRRGSEHDLAHGRIMACEYPDGPVLLWRRKRWHVVRGGRLRLPVVIVESQLVSQLAEIRRMFPALKGGVCGSDLAAKAFAEAGLSCTFVGKVPRSPQVRWHQSWQALADCGL